MKNDVEYRVCFPEQRIFISEDHNWAFSAWEIGKQRGYIDSGAALVHIDAHVDYVDPEIEIIEEVTTEKDAIDFGRNLGIAEFIIPAQQAGTIGSVYMISNDSVFINEETGFNRAYSLNHFEHLYRRKWFDETEGKNVILDIDLDFFNFNYEDMYSNAVLLPEQLIRRELEYIKKYMWKWDMITVALSPDFCGGREESKYLFNLFMDVFNLDIGKAIPW